jgi:hypothetical protein
MQFQTKNTNTKPQQPVHGVYLPIWLVSTAININNIKLPEQRVCGPVEALQVE